MHPEIVLVQTKVLDLYARQRAYLAGKPVAYVEELLHRSEELRNNGDTFTVRAAAQINHAACVMILEERRAKQ